jgi:hypothetical protein
MQNVTSQQPAPAPSYPYAGNCTSVPGFATVLIEVPVVVYDFNRDLSFQCTVYT